MSLQITTTNGIKMEITSIDISYFRCNICEQNVVIYWNKEKEMFSELYISVEEATALALKGLQPRRDIENDGNETIPENGYTCQECVLRSGYDPYPRPLNDEDYLRAYGNPDRSDED